MAVFSLKHQNGKEKEELTLQCPVKFNGAVQSGNCECTKDKCAWWMIQQKACAVNVNARIYGYVQTANMKPFKP